MKANWSLVLNIVLLFGVVLAIARLLLLRKKETNNSAHLNDIDFGDTDDIIAVRKLDNTDITEDIDIQLSALNRDGDCKESGISAANDPGDLQTNTSKNLMLFLSAQEQREFSGYELLQSLLAAGLRFGEGNIFHKYQKENGQGTVLFSLAAATASGTFDLQTMGSYSVRGLCLYMYLSGNNNIDAERFTLMHDTAKALAEDLNANLLDDRQKNLSPTVLDRYYSYINAVEEEA